jgi:hypothetical protein
MQNFNLTRTLLTIVFVWPSSIFSIVGICQDSTYLVPPGIHPIKVIPATERFVYPKFQSGVLHFSTGKKSDEFLLNYNTFAQEIQLLDSNGDTVALDNKISIVEFIQIQSDFYFWDMRLGYFLVLTKEEPLNLLKRIKWKSIDFSKGVSSYQKTYDYYFLIASPNRVVKAEKSALMKIFPNARQEINSHLSEINMDFNNESSLRELITFCNGLATSKGHK